MVKERKQRAFMHNLFSGFSTKMHNFKRHTIQKCVFLLILILCCRLIQRESDYKSDCWSSEQEADGKNDERCIYERYSSSPLGVLVLRFTNQNLTPLLNTPYELYEWHLLLLMYLIPLATYQDGMQAKTRCSYIVRRLIRLIISLLIGPAIFLLPPKIYPKLYDHGVVMRYLFPDSTLNKYHLGLAVSLLLYELLLFSVFFYGSAIINIMKKLTRWSLQHLTVIIFGFVVLTFMSDGFITFIRSRERYSEISLFHFGVMLYVLQTNEHLRSKMQKHTCGIGFCMLCAAFFSSAFFNRFVWRIPFSDGLRPFILTSAHYLLVVFLFSLFKNFLALEYTVKMSNNDATEKPLLAETA